MSKPILVLTIGISGSGKTSWVEEFIKDNPDWINLNRDDFRFGIFNNGKRDWTKYKFNNVNEKRVSTHVDCAASMSSDKRQSIICSDTNLNPKIRKKWYDWAKENDYEVVTKEFIISWEEAVKRNTQREGGVTLSILRSQFERMNEYLGRKTYIPNESLPKAIIIDLDGTVADMKGIRKPYEWGKVSQDKPRGVVITMVQSLIEEGYTPIFLSGRDGCCVKDTYDCIMENIMMWYLPNNGGFHLFMREPNDNRKDTIVKEELFWKYIAGKFNVCAAFDDRPCIVNLWNELGVPNVIAVSDQLKEF